MQAHWPAQARSGSLRPRLPLIAAYVRSQLAAVMATAIDFAITVICVELIAVHYMPATAIGGISGGLTAFLVNRHWSFVAGHRALLRQAACYALVWACSLSLNCLLVYLMTDKAGFPYAYSKALTAVMVGAGFNFPLHRHFVFR